MCNALSAFVRTTIFTFGLFILFHTPAAYSAHSFIAFQVPPGIPVETGSVIRPVAKISLMASRLRINSESSLQNHRLPKLIRKIVKRANPKCLCITRRVENRPESIADYIANRLNEHVGDMLDYVFYRSRVQKMYRYFRDRGSPVLAEQEPDYIFTQVQHNGLQSLFNEYGPLREWVELPITGVECSWKVQALFYKDPKTKEETFLGYQLTSTYDAPFNQSYFDNPTTPLTVFLIFENVIELLGSPISEPSTTEAQLSDTDIEAYIPMLAAQHLSTAQTSSDNENNEPLYDTVPTTVIPATDYQPSQREQQPPPLPPKTWKNIPLPLRLMNMLKLTTTDAMYG